MKVTLTDESGKVIFEGIAHSYDMHARNAYQMTEFTVRGIVPRKKEAPKDIGDFWKPHLIGEWFNKHTHAHPSGPVSPPMAALNPYVPADVAASSKLPCNHQWKHYEGFTKTYDFCETCGMKQNES